MLDRGTFTLPRLNAQLVVLAAAALTTLVAVALATTLVVFSDQVLPRAVHQRLTAASGTAMIVAGPITNTDAAGYTAAVRTDMTAALAGAPSAFYQAYWSDPLGLPVTGRSLIPIAVARRCRWRWPSPRSPCWQRRPSSRAGHLAARAGAGVGGP